MGWKYNDDDYDPNASGTLPVGKYRIRIKEIAVGYSKTSGKQMWTLTYEVSGSNSHLWDYLVFDESNAKNTNQKLGAIFDSFGIGSGNVDPDHVPMEWIGRVGGCKVKHEEYMGDTNAKVHYLLKREQVDKLAPWEEPSNGSSQTGTVAAAPAPTDLPGPPDASSPISDNEDLPF